MKYEFEELGPNEMQAAQRIIQNIVTDPKAHDGVNQYNKENLRCSLTVFMAEDGKGKEACFYDETETLEKFPFEPIKEALDFYEPGESICIILVRGNKVTVTVAGDM